MKKIFNFCLMVALITIISCKEEDLTGIPALPPRITINSPGAVVANIGADLSATVTDGANSPVASVQFDLMDQSGKSVASKIFNESFSEGPNQVKWSVAESKLNELPAGDYKFRITATDTKSKVSVDEAVLKVLALNPECMQEGKVTIVLLAPNAPDGSNVGFVGSPTGWGGVVGSDVVMSKITDGVYCGAVSMAAGAEFKFRLNENWSTQEGKLDGNCSDGDNRVYSGTGTDLIVEQVAVWKPCP